MDCMDVYSIYIYAQVHVSILNMYLERMLANVYEL